MFTNFGVRPGASPEADAEVERWGFCFFPRSLMNFAADMSATKYGYLPPLNSVAWYTKFGIANRYTVTNAGIALIGVYASQIEYPRDYGVYAGSAGRLQLQRHRYLDQGQAYSQGRRKHSAPPTDKTYVNQKKAGAILEPLFAEQPEHPGVAHYFIHAYDYPPLADRGLDAARRYAQIAQDSPHALHVPSHIFTRLGLWQESIDSNLASAAPAPQKKQCAGEQAPREGLPDLRPSPGRTRWLGGASFDKFHLGSNSQFSILPQRQDAGCDTLRRRLRRGPPARHLHGGSIAARPARTSGPRPAYSLCGDNATLTSPNCNRPRPSP